MSHITKLIRDDFNETLRLMIEIPSELKRSIIQNERYPIFLRNIEQQLLAVKNLKRETIKYVVGNFTHTFMRNVKMHCEERGMSQLEQSRLKKVRDDKATKLRIVDKIVETGVIDEEDIEEYPEG